MRHFSITKSDPIMDRKVSRGEYLAPEVRVEEMGVMLSILQVSGDISVGGNPFSGNDEEEW